MAVDATGTPTSPDNIPTYTTATDIPSGKGFNAAMAQVQTALSLRAPIANPIFTGIPAAPTPVTGDNSTTIATTAYVKAQLASTPIHALMVGTGTALSAIATGSAGQYLRSGGAAADPLWSIATLPSTAGTAGNVLRSDGTNFLSAKLASTDVSWPGSGNPVSLLSKLLVPVTTATNNTGVGFFYTLPGGVVGINSAVRLRFSLDTIVTGGVTFRVKLVLGASTIWDSGALSSSSRTFTGEILMLEQGTLSSQSWYYTTLGGTTSWASSVATSSSEDISVNKALNLTISSADVGFTDVTLNYVILELLP